jgi:hypothetical protein
MGGKDREGNGGDNGSNAGGSGQELDCAPDRDGPPLPPLSGGATATWVSEGKDNNQGNGDNKEGSKQQQGRWQWQQGWQVRNRNKGNGGNDNCGGQQ